MRLELQQAKRRRKLLKIRLGELERDKEALDLKRDEVAHNIEKLNDEIFLMEYKLGIFRSEPINLTLGDIEYA